MGIDHCPTCGAKTKVTDSRPSNNTLRRRRVCLADDAHRYTTYELMISPNTLPRLDTLELGYFTRLINALMKVTLYKYVGLASPESVRELEEAVRAAPAGPPPAWLAKATAPTNGDRHDQLDVVDDLPGFATSSLLPSPPEPELEHDPEPPTRPVKFHVYPYDYRCDACGVEVTQTRPASQKARAVSHAGCAKGGVLRFQP